MDEYDSEWYKEQIELDEALWPLFLKILLGYLIFFIVSYCISQKVVKNERNISTTITDN